MALDVQVSFDQKTFQRYLNGFKAVGHAHHYLALLIQMAEKYKEYGGIQIMVESTEDALRPVFDDYVQKHDVGEGADRLKMAAEFYDLMGMGQMQFSGDAAGGEVVLTRSHVDEGWIRKYGPADRPLNYWSCGYIAAMFGCAFNRAPRSYDVEETAGIVMGNKVSRFAVKRK